VAKGKHNAAVYCLSSRTHLLKECLGLFYENWNHKYDYPVYIHHFDQIYPQEFVDDIKNSISKNIFFHQIDYGVPSHISEKDLFYNRRYLRYVRKTFPISRIGYLHMEYFVSNLHKFGEKGCVVKELEKYDYIMRIDDDSWFKQRVEYDFFDYAVDTPIASGYSWCHENWRHEDTTESLWPFYLNYLKLNNIDVKDIKNEVLRNAALSQAEQVTFPQTVRITCGNLNIYNVRMLKDAGFSDWMNAVNEYGGNYKHRWGDIEILALFTGTMFEKPVHDLDLIKQGVYEPRLLSTELAPSIQKDELSTSLRLKNKAIDKLTKLAMKYRVLKKLGILNK